MNTSSLLAALAFLLQVTIGGGLVVQRPLHRSKRTLFQMCELIQRHTNRGCLDYMNYGCFCGLGNAGSSRKHLDDVDGCCRLHDQCWGDVTCLFIYPQIVGYDVQCNATGECECKDSRIWSPCARSVCECDLRFAQCLGRARYHNHHRHYPWQMCQDHSPGRD